MKRERWEVRMAGEGGQGLALAGLILADAAVRDGKNVAMTHSYGAQQRGGPSYADVIISSGEIDYPRVIDADVLVIFSEKAFGYYEHRLASDGLLVIDGSQIEKVPIEGVEVIPVPFSDISQKVTGNTLSANMVVLGFVAELTKLVSHRAIVAALKDRSPQKGLLANRAALEEGIQAARSTKGR